MNWIIWREYRLNRLILVTGAVLLLLPYLGALIILWWRYAKGLNALPIAGLFAGATLFSLILSQLTVALLGGNAIAGERADRSAEFIAYLPLPRIRLLGGKLTLALSAVTMIWGTNLLVQWILLSSFDQTHPTRSSISILSVVGYNIAITGLVFYCVGWLISSFQSSPTFAVGGGLITPLLIIMGLQAAGWSTDGPFDQFLEKGYATICPILALVCFSIGTWYYLKRVEP